MSAWSNEIMVDLRPSLTSIYNTTTGKQNVTLQGWMHPVNFYHAGRAGIMVAGWPLVIYGNLVS